MGWITGMLRLYWEKLKLKYFTDTVYSPVSPCWTGGYHVQQSSSYFAGLADTTSCSPAATCWTGGYRILQSSSTLLDWRTPCPAVQHHLAELTVMIPFFLSSLICSLI